MVPVTPSPRRGTFKRFSDLQRNASNDVSQILSEENGDYHAIPLPPLYYKKPEENVAWRYGRGSLSSFQGKKPKNVMEQELVYKTPEKTTTRPLVSQSRSPFKNSFVPIERPPLPRSSATPPISPLVGKNIFTAGSASPAYSVASVAPTEDMTEGTLTPTPTTSYLQAANSSPYSSSHQYRQGAVSLSHPRSAGRSPGIGGGGAFGPPLSPRKSPNKYYQQHRSSGSPLPYYSSHHGSVPYSPGGSSVGSRSTTTSSADDVVRKQRVKTELCMHYMNGRMCPFQDRCTFAHGEEELQMTTLMDLQRAGLIEDADSYRTKPCLTWVATGSCPFGKRCSALHDPRIIGPHASWLPHTETQGNSMDTDINVDGLHQKRLAAIVYDNPFGEQFSMEMDEFADLYKLICNSTNSNKRRRNNMSDIHKLAIALEMRGSHGWMYKFRPQHFIFDELCMVLQKRAFHLEKSGKVTAIPINAFNSKNSQHVLVREIAFGPDSDTTVRGVALWFNIPEHKVSECSPQQAKRYRWKKAPKFDDQRALEKKPSVFDSRECFHMIRPIERDAFDLATSILRHRHAIVNAERLATLSERFDALKELQKEKDDLQEIFHNHKRSWAHWAWPINTGRQSVEHDTPVPPVDGWYNPMLDQDAMEKAMCAGPEEQVEPVKGSAIESIWESFVLTKLQGPEVEDPAPAQGSSRRYRLSIFARLAEGEQICPDRNLPHIIRSSLSFVSKNQGHKAKAFQSAPCPSRQSELCWKALMLKQEATHASSNDWEEVRAHFQNARCKKVLNILQK